MEGLDNMEQLIANIATLVPIAIAIVALIVALYKSKAEKEVLDATADKTQTEVSVILADSTRLLLDPLRSRIMTLEQERESCMKETEQLRTELNEIKIEIKDLRTKLEDAETYILQLSHQLLSWRIEPITRSIMPKKEGE
jgi:chromosome segregation ATPase